MNCKQLVAVGLVLGSAFFFPGAALAAEPNIRIEQNALHSAQSDSLLASGESFPTPDVLRRDDAAQAAALLPAMMPFPDMWALICKYQSLHHSHFSPELIAALFWEESGFRMVEHPVTHASGFGQVLPSTLSAVNKRFGMNFTTQDMITSPDASVHASVLALELAWEWKRDKAGALSAYAGGARNQHIVHKWLAAESAMRKGRIPYGTSFGMGSFVEQYQIRALRLCSRPGFDPQAIFD